MTANAAALLELMARAITKIIPTKGEPIKKTCPTPLRIKFIVPERGSKKITTLVSLFMKIYSFVAAR